MLFTTWRDLQWRRKRFTIAVVAVALTLGLSLLMSGVATAFPREADRVLDAMGATSFLMAEDEIGVFTSASVVPADAIPNGRGFFFWNSPVRGGSGVRQAALIGIDRAGPGRISEGRGLRASGEVVVDETLDVAIGAKIELAGSAFSVVGLTSGTTLYGGQPVVFLRMADAQRLVANGQKVTKGFVEVGGPANTGPVPDGWQRVSRAAALDDLLRPLANAQQTLVVIMVLLWIISACIIGSVMFLTVLERIRDFAVFKANGVSNRSIAVGLVVQAVVLAGIASIIGIALGHLMRPMLDMPVEISVGWTFAMPVIAVAVAIVASLLAMRRVLSVEPALAFGAA
jgi:putative ABC transport system permease protein